MDTKEFMQTSRGISRHYRASRLVYELEKAGILS